MRAALDLLVEEMTRLRAEGVETLAVSDAALEGLTARIEALAPASAARQPERAPRRAGATTAGAPRKPRAREVDPALAALIENPAQERAALERESEPKHRGKGLPPGLEIEPIPAPPTVALPEGDKAERWRWLRERVLNCPVCQAHVREGKQVVFGVGSLEADVFFCGEAPGAEEEAQGEPFVGPAGQLLTKIIKAMGLERDDVYIGNIMNWRPEMPTPTGNRHPTEEEMGFCLPYLRAQIEVVQPKVVVALGNTAVTGLLGPDPQRRLGKIRGKWHDFEGTPLMVTYHPRYLLRDGSLRTKRMVWEDMLAVMEHIGLPISERQRNFFT